MSLDPAAFNVLGLYIAPTNPVSHLHLKFTPCSCYFSHLPATPASPPHFSVSPLFFAAAPAATMNPLKKTILTLIIAVSLLMAHATAASGHKEEEEEEEEEKGMIDEVSTSVRGFGSFLPQNKHTCKRDPSICFVKGSPGPFCCKKVCVDVKVDRRNCGGCKNKCKKKEICCSGRCVFAYKGCDSASLALQA